MDIELSIGVFQRHLGHPAVIYRGQIDSLSLHQLRTKGDPLRGVMISADSKDLYLPLRQSREKTVENLHRLGGGHSLVIDVPRQKNSLRLLPLRYGKYFVQNIFLILQHRKFIDALSDMQI